MYLGPFHGQADCQWAQSTVGGLGEGDLARHLDSATERLGSGQGAGRKPPAKGRAAMTGNEVNAS